MSAETAFEIAKRDRETRKMSLQGTLLQVLRPAGAALVALPRVRTFSIKDNHAFGMPISESDIHLVLETDNPLKPYLHVRGYVPHVLDAEKSAPKDKVLLTGYWRGDLLQDPFAHAFRQDWYVANAVEIATEIIKQNPWLAEKK